MYLLISIKTNFDLATNITFCILYQKCKASNSIYYLGASKLDLYKKLLHD